MLLFYSEVCVSRAPFFCASTSDMNERTKFEIREIVKR